MLRGDLLSTPLGDVLRQLAQEGGTGCLVVRTDRPALGNRPATVLEAEIHLKDGEVYAAAVRDTATAHELDEPDADERLRTRLLAEGRLDEAAWDDALQAQEELFDWTVGELLVELGHLDETVLHAIAAEELLEAVTSVTTWTVGPWRFRRRARARHRAGRNYPVAELLTLTADRRREREELAVPDGVGIRRTDSEVAADSGLPAAIAGVLDGERDVEALAAACGCSVLEAARVVRALCDAGTAALPEPVVATATAPGAEDEDPLSRWSALLDSALPPAVEEAAPLVSVQRVKSDLPTQPADDVDPAVAERRARLRSRAAEELLAAQAEAEALRERAAAAAAVEDLSVVVPEIVHGPGVQDAALVDDVAPVEDQVPVDDVAPVEDQVPVEDVGPSRTSLPSTTPPPSRTWSRSRTSPVDDTTPLDDTTPVEDLVPVEDVAPVEDQVPVEDVAPVEDQPPVDDTAPLDDTTPVEDEHDPALAAALLRELSSLGLDDEPATAAVGPVGPARPSTTPRVPPQRPAAAARKRRGIFGR